MNIRVASSLDPQCRSQVRSSGCYQSKPQCHSWLRSRPGRTLNQLRNLTCLVTSFFSHGGPSLGPRRVCQQQMLSFCTLIHPDSTGGAQWASNAHHRTRRTSHLLLIPYREPTPSLRQLATPPFRPRRRSSSRAIRKSCGPLHQAALRSL